MKRKIKRWLTMATALALVLGSIQYTPMFTQASENGTALASASDNSSVSENNSVSDNETGVVANITPAGDAEDKSWTVDKLTYNYASAGYTLNGDKYELSFASQYKEIKLQLPENIDMTKCSAVTFAISEQSCPVAFKLYDAEGTELDFTKYSQSGKTLYTYELSRTESVGYVGVMMNDNLTDQTCVFDGVMFDMVAEEAEEPEESTNITPAGDAEDKSWTVDKLTYNYASAGYTLNGDKYELSFASQYKEIKLQLPENIDMTKCSAVTFAISEQSCPVAFKLYDAEGTELDFTKYSQSGKTLYTYELSRTESVGYVGVMMNDNLTDQTCVFDGVMFDMVAEEAEEPGESTGEVSTRYYTFSDVSVAGGYLYVADVTDAGTLDVSFEGQYQEVKYNLPEGVDGKTIESITFHVVEGEVSNLAIKLYADGSADNTSYESDTLNVTKDITGADAFTFALMNKGESATSFVIDYFTITAVQTGGSETAPENGGEVEETYEIVYGYSDLTLDWTNGTCELVDGGYKVDFSALNEEARFKLPEAVNLENCKSITYTVASQNGPINLYVGSDGTKIKSYWYKDGAEAYTVAPEVTNKINTIGIQCAGETYTEGSTVIVTGVTFVMKGSKPLPTPTDGVYTYEYFEEAEVSEGVIVEEADGTALITFPEAGDSITLVIPDSVDVNHLVSIDLVMDVNTVAAFNLRAAATTPEIVVEVLDKNLKPIVSTTEDSIATNCHSEAKYIRLTSNTPNTVLDLEKVKFNIDMDAFEAIVLNGNFDREDMSVWGSALWGSVDGVDTTITGEVSDTPIFDDVYTYGHISDRSSPYVCFAQDLTARVKKGQWYKISYWVRLDAEDYRDQGMALREITCSPYFIDGDNVTQYGLVPYGYYRLSVEPGVWTYMECKIEVPANAETYVLRIVEQGTKYGQGTCVMGSYDITGVKMVECDAPPTNKYSGGGGGGAASANTTVTKEASWTGTYNMNELLVEWASADYEKNASNGLNITFDNNYDEVRMDLPRELDMSTAAYVKAKISSQNVPIAVKLYYKGSQVDVGYYNDIKSEYTLVPTYTGKVDAIGIMSLATPNPADAYANFDSITFGLTEEPAPLPVRTEIVLNGDFTDADLADWKASFWGDGVTMTQKTSSKAIAPGVYNYAEYSKRTSPYQCFAQDITEMVEEGETYTFSFWGKLSKDYEGAPESQRIIQFAPYTVDSDGTADYNPKLEGNYLQICEPGVWTYFEGKYKVTNPNDVKKVVIRILEQGTNYGQGDCVLGSFAIADVKMAKYIPEPPSIDEDVPNLKDVLPEVFGEDFLIGTAVTLDEIDDIGVEMLANKHFNAITLGNELKPDALFNYSNSAHTQLQTITFNGQSLEVPTLSFYRAEEVLDKILKWNESHPESPIKVRGHVLVWHSQTPEWWFREGYVVGQNADGTENYVTPEVMNLRLEWYVKTVLEHFTGENSKYKDLFYGWDVVNEAVSNGGNGYRTDKVSSLEAASLDTHSNNSSWWAVYQSNEFIINAFKYANMYAPADVELYYNDYNECDNKKMVGIVKLLSDVKEAEGTRIDGMGMQAHYNMFNPSVKAFENAIRAYAEVVGEVHITEWDMKASGSIDNEDKKQAEYLAQGERYRNFYEILKALDAEEGIEIGGITFWGTVDHHSWLQESSTVGGGADGDLTHCPLLFSDSYKVKPAYWAFVDYSVIDPDYVAPELVGPKTEEKQEENAEDNKEEVKEEQPSTGDASGETGNAETPVTEATPEPEKQEASAPATQAPKADEAEEGNNVVPIAVGGGVAGVGIIGAIVALMKKRKKVTE